MTLRQLVQIVGEEVGIEPKLAALPRLVTRTLLPALGRFTPPLRGLADNVYSGYEPYIVDHSAFVERFGDHETPLRKAIRATVQWHRAGARAARPTAA